jgi:molybdenum cofactor synthesis domain-containing protein
MEKGKYTAAVVTVSDRASTGIREDTGGPLICDMLESAGYTLAYSTIVPDERPQIEDELIRCADKKNIALICTTGGTGFAPRDVTPEATIAVCERLIPGIPEAMRTAGMRVTDRAMLSRMVAGIRSRSLIINLPGSPKAIRENLQAVLAALDHGLDILRGPDGDHG